MQYLGMRIPGRKRSFTPHKFFFDMNGHRFPCSLQGNVTVIQILALRHGNYSTISATQDYVAA